VKIVVEQGTSMDETLELVVSFLKNNYSDYSLLKGNLNMYITLKNDLGQVCPDNEREFVLSHNNVVDVVRVAKEQAYKDALRAWDFYIAGIDWEISRINKRLKTNMKYIDSAVVENRKQENVDKRIAENSQLKKRLDVVERDMFIVRSLDNVLRNGSCDKIFIQHTYGSVYKYDIECVFIFKDVEGFTGYFKKGSLRVGELNLG